MDRVSVIGKDAAARWTWLGKASTFIIQCMLCSWFFCCFLILSFLSTFLLAKKSISCSSVDDVQKSNMFKKEVFECLDNE